MTSLDETISEYQNDLDAYIRKCHETNNNIHYDNIISRISKLENILLENLSSLPEHKNISPNIDIYTEALTNIAISQYLKKQCISLPPYCTLLILSVHLILSEIFICNRTLSEWNKYRQTLIDESLRIFGENPKHEGTVTLIKYLNIPIDESDKSALWHAKYFINYTFKPEFINITCDNLPQYGEDVNYILVNASYNNDIPESIVLYKDILKTNARLLNPQTIDKFIPYEVKQPVQSTSWYTICDSHLNPTKEIKYNTYILLCYNDDRFYQKCHYSVAFGDEDFITPSEAKLFISHVSNRSITKADIDIYRKKMILKLCEDEQPSVRELFSQITKLKDAASRCFDNDRNTCIKNLINNPTIKSVLHPNELKWFAIYIQKIKVLPIYTIASVADVVCDYVCEDIFNDPEFSKM